MIGVDFGASYLDVAVVRGRKLERTYSIPQKYYSPQFLLNILKNEILEGEDGKSNVADRQNKPFTLKKQRRGAKAGTEKTISITGGKASEALVSVVGKNNPNIRALRKSMKIREVGEIRAIAEGAKFLSGREKFVVLNVGTGTPIVFVEGNKVIHLAGTGIGGGTLEGLGKLLLGAQVSELEGLMARGHGSLDLTVGDVLGRGLGNIPADATASNFGKTARLDKIQKEDVAISILKMVGEILGIMGVLAARARNLDEAIYTGRVVDENKFIRERISNSTALFGVKAHFPKDSKYCTAIGAAIAGK
ncbi:MAG TPA: hypothetical protein VJI13_00640 [Candidatus Norongarragalinales archaeon]|nr:hypothetical protein [Candidatus Norongarragalinales archaeon]